MRVVWMLNTLLGQLSLKLSANVTATSPPGDQLVPLLDADEQTVGELARPGWEYQMQTLMMRWPL